MAPSTSSSATIRQDVLIKAGTDDDTITVKIFGDMPEGVDISVQTEVTERIEPGSIQRWTRLRPLEAARSRRRALPDTGCQSTG